ncbi:MAG: DUF222 domain-containing protein [Actinomycetota bacterium]
MTKRASAEWAADGHRSVTAGLRVLCNQSKPTCRARVVRARKLDQLPHLLDALEAGDVTADAAEVLLRADQPRTHDAFVEAEKDLVDRAKHLPFDRLVRFVRTWTDVVDPDGADQTAGKRDEARSLTASKSLEGQVKLDGWLTAAAGAEFRSELERRVQVLFDDDWAEARERLGKEAKITAADLGRTADQRRHDALREIVRRSAAYTGDGPAPAPSWVLNLHMDFETFIAELARHHGDPYSYPEDRLCEIENGPVITPSEALGLALGGEIRRVVFGADGHVLDYGRAQRFFPEHLAGAVKTRDRTCRHPGCDLPAAACETDHVVEWQHHGSTSERNGEAVCRFHNLWKTNNPERWRRLRERVRRPDPPPRE